MSSHLLAFPPSDIPREEARDFPLPRGWSRGPVLVLDHRQSGDGRFLLSTCCQYTASFSIRLLKRPRWIWNVLSYLVDIDKWNKIESEIFHRIGHALAVPPYGSDIDHSGRERYLFQGLSHELLHQRGFGWEWVV